MNFARWKMHLRTDLDFFTIAYIWMYNILISDGIAATQSNRHLSEDNMQ